MRTGDEARTEVTLGDPAFFNFIFNFFWPCRVMQDLSFSTSDRTHASQWKHWTAREDPRDLRWSVLRGPRSLPMGPALQRTLPERMATESGGVIWGQRTEGDHGHGRGAPRSLAGLSLHLVSSSAK